jgi:hypothetical protein
MNIKDLSKPLDISQVDFRVQSINKGGYATILAYKDSRVDMHILDTVVGELNWQKKYEIVNDNLFCSVGIYNDATKEWIWKQDVGTESPAEKEKGQASDAFKRACFNWGIGRELYEYPIIQIKLNDNEYDKATGKPTWDFKLKQWKWFSGFEGGKLIYLACKDEKGVLRFTFGKGNHPKPPITDERFEKALAGIKDGTVKKNALDGFELTKEQKAKLLTLL